MEDILDVIKLGERRQEIVKLTLTLSGPYKVS